MNKNGKIKILGIAGSLRRGSYNKAILKAAAELLPIGSELGIFEKLGEIPPFDQDQENSPPPVVVDLKEQIRSTDAVLIATPEYNYSVPGVLKNAIDWASRPYGDSAWDRKPVAIMSASSGMLGGARAQYHLRQIFVFLNMFPLNGPEVIIPEAGAKINVQGNLVDQYTREKIAELLQALLEWTTRLERAEISPREVTKGHPYRAAYASQSDSEKKYMGEPGGVGR